MRIARARKAIAAAVGTAITYVLLVPQDAIPERLRPYVGLVLALGTVLGVYSTRNAPPPRVAPTLFARRPLADYEEHDQPKPPPRSRPRE